MIYEHSMMFRLDTPPAAIAKVIASAQDITNNGLLKVSDDKRRLRIRELGNHVFKLVTFEVEADEPTIDRLRDRLWEEHPHVISTLTIPHSTHERITPFSPQRWTDAVSEYASVVERADRYPWFEIPVNQPDEFEVAEPSDRFSREALMDRFLREGPRKERKITRPPPR